MDSTSDEILGRWIRESEAGFEVVRAERFGRTVHQAQSMSASPCYGSAHVGREHAVASSEIAWNYCPKLVPVVVGGWSGRDGRTCRGNRPYIRIRCCFASIEGKLARPLRQN